MKHLRTIFFLCLTAFCGFAKAQVFDGPLTVSRDIIHNPNGPHSGVPIVSSDDDNVIISCDSIIHDMTIVIKDQYGSVMHQSTQTVGPNETTLYVPDQSEDSEKTTIDLYYDRKHLSGAFEE